FKPALPAASLRYAPSGDTQVGLARLGQVNTAEVAQAISFAAALAKTAAKCVCGGGLGRDRVAGWRRNLAGPRTGRSGVQQQVAQGLGLGDCMAAGELEVNRVGHVAGHGKEPAAMPIVGEVVASNRLVVEHLFGDLDLVTVLELGNL